MLKTANLTSDDVNLVKLEASEIPQYLKNNLIQAGHTWQPHLSEAMKLGGNILFTSKQTPGLILDMIVFRGDTIRDRPEDIRAFVRGWLQASKYWKANVQEGNAIISKTLKISSNTLSLEGVSLTDLNENKKLFESSNPNSIYKTAKIYADFFIRSGNVSRIPDLKSLFNSSFLNPAS
jgi:NitT/TauT family transport system substrate-binding protein